MNRESAAKKIQSAYQKKYGIQNNKTFLKQYQKHVMLNYPRNRQLLRDFQLRGAKINSYSTRKGLKHRHELYERLMNNKHKNNINKIKTIQRAHKKKYGIQNNNNYAKKYHSWKYYDNNNNTNESSNYQTQLKLREYVKRKEGLTRERNVNEHKYYKKIINNLFKKTMEPRTFNAGKAGKMSIPNDIMKIILKKAY